MDSLLASLRSKGSQHLMLEAAAVLSPQQPATACAAAMEIMRSDGLLEPDECNSLANLAEVLALDAELTADVGRVMDVLHADLEA